MCYQPLGTLEAHGGHGRVMAGAMTGAWLDHGTRPGLQLYAHGADYGSRASNLIIYFVLGEGEGVRLTGEVRVPLPDGGEGARRPCAGPY